MVADTTNAFVVSETGGSNRIYIPSTDIETSEFTKSETATHCPHKGDTEYWHHDGAGVADIAWCYPAPLEEATRIAGHCCFDGENVQITRSPG